MIAIPFQPREIAFLIVAVWYLKENITKCCMGMERKKKSQRQREGETKRDRQRRYTICLHNTGFWLSLTERERKRMNTGRRRGRDLNSKHKTEENGGVGQVETSA